MYYYCDVCLCDMCEFSSLWFKLIALRAVTSACEPVSIALFNRRNCQTEFRFEVIAKWEAPQSVLYIRCDNEVIGQNIWDTGVRWGIHTENLDRIENLKVNDHLGYHNVDERTTLKWIFKKQGAMECNSARLWSRWWIFKIKRGMFEPSNFWRLNT
jgi:hypothetical protein